jgi:hypothetical protein
MINLKGAVLDTGTNTCDAIRLPDGRWQILGADPAGALAAHLEAQTQSAKIPSRTQAKTGRESNSTIPG